MTLSPASLESPYKRGKGHSTKNIILIKPKGNYTIGHAKMKDEEIVEKVEHDIIMICLIV